MACADIENLCIESDDESETDLDDDTSFEMLEELERIICRQHKQLVANGVLAPSVPGLHHALSSPSKQISKEEIDSPLMLGDSDAAKEGESGFICTEVEPKEDKNSSVDSVSDLLTQLNNVHDRIANMPLSHDRLQPILEHGD